MKNHEAGSTTIPWIAGVGASAGGLKAISTMLENMPSDLGIAIVIIQHLDPNSKSSLAEILSSKTELPVEEVHSDIFIQPNHIYVIAPGTFLTLSQGILQVTSPVSERASRNPIDKFLKSLAENSGRKSIGIILSGTGSDGTAGLRAVKARGGLSVVQAPCEAEQSGMPQSAINTIRVDHTLRAAQIGPKLRDYVDFESRIAELSCEPNKTPSEHIYTKILDLLNEKCKEDFRHYRTNTIERRIKRRMGLVQAGSINNYLEIIKDDPTEMNNLRRDLLIGVTRFFRDKPAWHELELALESLVELHDTARPLRAWSVGCATGEEAYSLAMLLQEQCSRKKASIPFQVFASDMSEDALAIGREGLYPASIANDISSERLNRFFLKETGGYRISTYLRDSVLFANHNVLSQAPFFNIDVILCRNLLIYLKPESQEMLMNIFQFALSVGGLLMLGKTESVGNSNDLFGQVSKTHRLFKRTDLKRSFHKQDIFTKANYSRPLSVKSGTIQTSEDKKLASCVQRQVFRQLKHAVVVINRDNRLLFVEGQSDLFLKLNSGELAAELPELRDVARHGIREKLRIAIAKAWSSSNGVVTEGQVQTKTGYKNCEIRIDHLLGRPPNNPALLITFTPLYQETTDEQKFGSDHSKSQNHNSPYHSQELKIKELEQELSITRDQLHGSVAELESANEQLRASNEEAMAMNEELQSSNEELETSKEELQSLNEELTTLNSQLESKLSELEESTNDLENLIHSSEVPTLFLDLNFHIRRFTPAFAKYCNLLPRDIGRPLTDIRLPFEETNLIDEAVAVLKELQPFERTIKHTQNSQIFRCRILPYRTEDHRVNGIAINLNDITTLEQAREIAERELALNQLLFQSTPVCLAVLDRDLQLQRINEQFAVICDRSVSDCLGKSIDEILPYEFATDINQHKHDLLNEFTAVKYSEIELRTENVPSINPETIEKPISGQRFFHVSYEPIKAIFDSELAIHVVVQEITPIKLFQSELASSRLKTLEVNRYLEAAQMAGRIGSWRWDSQSDKVTWSDAFTPMLGLDREEFPSTITEFWALVHPDDLKSTKDKLNALMSGLIDAYEVEFRIRRKQGDYSWVNARAVPELNDEGMLISLTGASIDITDRKHFEYAQAEKIDTLLRAFNNQSTAVWLLDQSGKIVEINDKVVWMCGHNRQDIIDKPIWSDSFWPEEKISTSIKDACLKAVKGEKVFLEAHYVVETHNLIELDLTIAAIRNNDDTTEYIIVSAIDVTHRKMVESALRMSESRFRALVDATAECVWTTDSNGLVEEDSTSWRDFTGQTIEQFLGQGWLQALHPEDRAPTIAAWKHSVDAKIPFEFEYRVASKEGQWHWFSARAVPVKDTKGKISRWVGLNVNIQRYKESLAIEENLREKLQFVLEIAQAAPWEATAEKIELHNIDLQNDNVNKEEITQLQVRRGLSKIHPEDRPLLEHQIRLCLAEGINYEGEYRILREDGSYSWIYTKALFSNDSKKPRLQGFSQDITKRKLSLIAAYQNERRLTAALEAGQMGLSEWDLIENQRFWNHFQYELLGLPPGDGNVSENLLIHYILPEDAPAYQKVIDEALEAKTDFRHEFRIRRADGEVRWLYMTGILDRTEAGEVSRIFSLQLDITEHKLVAEQLSDLNQRKNQFLAIIAHELRNPLSPIISGLEILKINQDQPSIIEQTLDTMDRQLQHIVAIVEDLVDVSQISRGMISLQRENINLKTVILDAVKIYEPQIKEAKHQINMHLSNEEIIVSADLKRLIQVVSNLICNAMKFTPSGGQIDVYLTASGSTAEISVHDTGIGVNREEYERLFEPFHLGAVPPTGQRSGLGLGLSLSKSIITLHDGSISVSSPGINKGSTFTIRLPRLDIPKVSEQKLIESDKSLSKPNKILPRLKILVVDDNQAVLQSLELLLRIWGQEVLTASDGQTAVELTSQFAPDLILLDLGMPRMDGFETAKAIKGQLSGINAYIVAMSGWGQPEVLESVVASGFDQHVVKPVSPTVLKELILRAK